MNDQKECPSCEELRKQFDQLKEKELRELQGYKVGFFIMLIFSSIQLGVSLAKLFSKNW